MKFEEIMDKIRLGLTGEVEKDVIYIMQKNAEYRKSPFAEKINKETGKMIYDMLPDEEKVLFGQILQEDNGEVAEKTKKAEKEIFDGNYAEAVKIIETIIPNICAEGQDGGNFDCVSLNNLFEMYVYTEIYKKGRLVKPTKFNFSYIYKLYGFSLFKLSKDNEAKKAYEDALFWNPVGVDLMLDLSEILYLNKQYKNFIELVKNILKYSYDINQISLCYYNLGRYYGETEKLDLAVNMYILSHYFKPNKAALKKLQKITMEKGIEINPLSAEEMKKICDEADIQMGVNPDIVKLAASAGTNAKKQGNIEAAKYFYDILFSLTGDKAVFDTVFDFMRDIKNNSDKNRPV